MICNKVLIIDDELPQLELLKMFFEKKGYNVRCAPTATEGLALHKRFQPEVTILDVRLPDMDGFEVLKSLKKNHPVIMITAFHDIDVTVKAMKMGACEYITKPIDLGELHQAFLRALRLAGCEERETVAAGSPVEKRVPIIGHSKAMKNVFKSIGTLSDNRITVLIEGETGTGKGLIAKAIHDFGPDREHTFLTVDCSTIVKTLLESELFGHEKGAFTGAAAMKQGQFELADNGTIFLDEIGETPLELQAKLLRFLQEREFQRVGGTKVLKSNARLIAATNRNLLQMVNARSFRQDLYYRLSVARIQVPPLRERKDDIIPLIHSLLQKINAEMGKNIRQVEKRAIVRMTEYNWPGNVRQLENVLTRAAIATQGGVVLDDTVQILLDMPATDGDIKQDGALCTLQDMERDHIEKVLNHTQWKLGEAARILGVSRPTLNLKIKQYQISRQP